jgi:alkaline phosphatase
MKGMAMSASGMFRTVRGIVVAAVALAAFHVFAMTPVPLAAGANTAFADDKADDRAGGWTDQGGNDMRLLPAGPLMAAGVRFEVLSDAATGGKSCIVLGGPKRAYLPAKASLAVPELNGECLYLLHAAAWCPPAKEQKMTGELAVDYTDGTSQTFHVRFGRDVGDWSKGESFKNAARGWTVYNGNTQVSLFASRFELKGKPVKGLRFESKESAWMIAAASIGNTLTLRPLRPNLALDKTYTAPEPPASALPDADEKAVPKNIILVIGDGMGSGALKLASLYQHKAEGRLFFQHLPSVGLCETYSASSDVTDSAAAATAIASGHKTKNGMLGLTPEGLRLTPFTAVAHRAGYAVGLITSDALVGATPAGFYAHVDARGSYQKVADDAAACGYEVLIGNANTKGWFFPKTAEGLRDDTRNVADEMAAKGYAVIETREAFAQTAADKRVLGFMAKGTLDHETCLAELTETALARLARNDKGFFLMVECTITDGGGHANNPELTVRGTLQVDWAVRQAVEFARTRGDTLVVVTADHETGGLDAVMSRTDPKRLVINYTTTSHTGAPVPVYAFGPGAHRFAGLIDNTDIGKKISALWGLTLPAPAKK